MAVRGSDFDMRIFVITLSRSAREAQIVLILVFGPAMVGLEEGREDEEVSEVRFGGMWKKRKYDQYMDDGKSRCSFELNREKKYNNQVAKNHRRVPKKFETLIVHLYLSYLVLDFLLHRLSPSLIVGLCRVSPFATSM
ncbi:hypothetical protein RIF29_29264 [Crotalaria pallida]|uniref:Uncharacterized protein n=1 Tax=Crotalaria pallida TaxID=3830 RepID=A0AAN9EGK3_CROPI